MEYFDYEKLDVYRVSIDFSASEELAKQNQLADFMYLTATLQPTGTGREIPHHPL